MGENTMTLTLMVLLCFGLCRDPWDQVQAEVVPKPSIWAEPGPLVTTGSPVTLWCQGSLQAAAYGLYKDNGSALWDIKHPQNSSKKMSFPFQSMSSHHAGIYKCAYYTTENRWTKKSEPLLLMVTGMYRKPSLSILPGPSVPWGAKVTLQCGSEIWFDTFHLHREGSLDPPQHLPVQNMTGTFQANFTISPVTSAHRGTYRCFGSHSASPYLLSHPSDPLELLVSDYTVENLIRMGVAGLVLVVLGVLLFQARNSPGRIHDAAMT
ncbi:leukocyte immunoglobulin-like receptor subfamily A member 5 [Molossus nigricans]